MDENEDKLRNMLRSLEMYKGYMEKLVRDGEMIDAHIGEHIRVKETLKKYEKVKEGQEILIPIGADTYIHARASSSKKILRSIGSKVSIEMNIKDAIEDIDRKIKLLEDTNKKVKDEIRNIEGKAQELVREIQTKYKDILEKEGE